VIAVDTNLLVYAHREDADWHARADRAVAGLAEGAAEWAIPWPCLHEFLAIVTHPRIFKTPTPPGLAFSQVEAWLESPSLVVLSENDDFFAALREVTLGARVTGSRVHDARVAALCVSHGVGELWTADRDFSLFSAIKTRNPLAG
jgi:toxin-antitoxin system PIN domain toxin